MAEHDQRFKTLIREFVLEFISLFFPAVAALVDLRGYRGRTRKSLSIDRAAPSTCWTWWPACRCWRSQRDDRAGHRG